MEANLKKILRAFSLELRHILEGTYNQHGKFQAGGLERRLNEIGIWRERPPKPIDELSHLSNEDKEARRILRFAQYLGDSSLAYPWGYPSDNGKSGGFLSE